MRRFLIACALLVLPCSAWAETAAIDGTETAVLFTGTDGKQYCWKKWSNVMEAGGNPFYGHDTGKVWYLDVYNPATDVLQRRQGWIEAWDDNGASPGGYIVTLYKWNGSSLTNQWLYADGSFQPGSPAFMPYYHADGWMENFISGADFEPDVPDGNCTPGNQLAPLNPMPPCEPASDPKFDGDENAINYRAPNGEEFDDYVWRERSDETINYGSENAWVLYKNGILTNWRLETVPVEGHHRVVFYDTPGEVVKTLGTYDVEPVGSIIPWGIANREMVERWNAQRDAVVDNDCIFGGAADGPPGQDTDGDGIPDDEDPDDDNDGEGDDVDPCPKDADCDSTNHDADGDGVPDIEDEDDDGDGERDENDETPRGDEYGDCDGDGIMNKYDLDDDNDGIPDRYDSEPCGREPDCDGDGKPDKYDPDDDNDGCPDESDPAPCDPKIKCDKNEQAPDVECPGSYEFEGRLQATKEAWAALGIDVSAFEGAGTSHSWSVPIPLPGGQQYTLSASTWFDSGSMFGSALQSMFSILRYFLRAVLAVKFCAACIRRAGAL